MMARRWLQGCLGVAGWAVVTVPGAAQIVPDATLGNEASRVSSGELIRGAVGDRINGGALRGSHLFHSFQQFNVNDGQRVYFANPAGVESILTRVTGNTVSNILGTLGVDGNANLFLINPNGILFGPNARLDIAGSLVASTASSFQFPDGSEFSATNPQVAPLLTVNVPLGLQYGNNPGPIRILPGANLRIPSNRTLALIGGNIEIDGGILQAPGARVELGGLSGAGTVTLSNGESNHRLTFPVGIPRADVILSNRSLVDVSAGGDGEIAINARNIDLLSASRLQGGIAIDAGSANSQAGNILVDVTDNVQIDDNSRILNQISSRGTGTAGNITIKANSVLITGNSNVSSSTFGTGNAGNVDIEAQDRLVLRNSLIASSVGNPAIQATGRGGNVSLNVRILEMSEGSQVLSRTFGNGDTGRIIIQAQDRITLAGTSADGRNPTAVTTSVAANGMGNGQSIYIKTNVLEVFNGASLITDTFGKGNAGDIIIEAQDNILLIGSDPDGIFPSISTRVLTLEREFEGERIRGGNIQINTRNLNLFDQAQISSQNLGNGNAGEIRINVSNLSLATRSGIETGSIGQGNAGDITIEAQNLVSLSDGSLIRSNIGSRSGVDSSGNVGIISINAENISLTNGGQLQAGFYPNTSGEAGKIVLRASDDVTISGVSTVVTPSRTVVTPSGIFTDVEPLSEGNGGEIAILARTFSLSDGAVIRSNTAARRNAGNIQVTAGDSANISNGAVIRSDTSARGDAGNIQITAGDSANISNGAVIRSATSSQGNAGNIQITAGNSTNISGSNLRTGVPTYVGAFTLSSGPAGNITFNTRAFRLSNGAVVDSTNTDPNRLRPGGTSNSTDSNNFFSGNSGSILINARTVDLINGGNLSVAADGSGQAGSITINARERVTVAGSDPTFNSRSQLAPNWTINFYNSNSTVLVRSRGSGSAGNVTITTPSLRLDQGTISAESATVDGGNIFIGSTATNPTKLGLLVMRNGSLISATAGTAQRGGDGGNITINAPRGFLVSAPNENNDIIANAFRGNGGRVTISAQNIYYFVPRSRTDLERLLGGPPLDPRRLQTNDITAISQENPDLSGVVTLNTLDVDPSRGLVQLPTGLVDPATLINQRCARNQRQRVKREPSTFYITGKGGIPIRPGDPPLGAFPTGDVRAIADSNARSPSSDDVAPVPQQSAPNAPIIEAEGWIRDRNGDILLIANTTSNTLHPLPLAHPDCTVHPDVD